MTLARMLIRLEADDKVFQQVLTRSVRSLGAFADAAAHVGRGMTLGVTLPLAFAANSIFDATLKIDSLRVGLEAMTGSANAAAMQMERLKQVAKEPGIGFAEAVQGSIQLQAVGFSARDAERSLKAFANAVAAGGGSSAQLERVVYQFTQMAAAGKVLGQDLRPMIQQSPLIAKALNNIFGTVSAAQIEKSVDSYEEFFELLISELERMPSVSASARTAVDNLSDAFERAQAAIGTKLLPALIPMVEGLTETFESMEDISAESAINATAWALTAAAMGPFLTVLGNIVSTFALLKIAFKTANPWIAAGGLIATGLVYLTKKFFENKLTVNDATQAIDDYAASLGGLSREQLQAAHTSALAQLGFLDTAIAAQEEEVRRMRRKGFSRLEYEDFEAQNVTPLKKAKEYLYNVSIPAIEDAYGQLAASSAEFSSQFSEDTADLPSHLEVLTAEANRLREALEVFPQTTTQWATAQRRAITLMGEATALANSQKNAIGETAVAYQSIVASLRDILSLGDVGKSFLKSPGDVHPNMAVPGTNILPSLTLMQVGFNDVAARARETAIAVHEYMMATDAAYAAQWNTTKQMQELNMALAIAKEEMRGQFAKPAETGARALLMVEEAALGVAQNFTPLGILAFFLSQLLEELSPAIEALLSPVAILAKAVMPALLVVFELAFPIIKNFGIALTYVGQVVFTVSGWIYKVVGNLVYGLGAFIDSIPGLGDFGLKNKGNDLIKMGDAALQTADNLSKARDELKNLEWDTALEKATKNMNDLSEAVSGAVQGFRVAQIRHEASAPVGPYAPVPQDEDRTARPRPTTTVVQGASFTTHLNFTDAGGAETYRQFYEELDNKTRSRGSSDLARQFLESLPEPN